MPETDLRELETLFLALNDKTRLRLLGLMKNGPVAVGFLADGLKESQPKISRHLAYMRNAGLVSTRRDGKWIYYEIRYPENAWLKKILETVVHSLAGQGKQVAPQRPVLRRSTSKKTRKVVRPRNNIYAEADMMVDNIYVDTDMISATTETVGRMDEEIIYGSDTEEVMDVFLL